MESESGWERFRRSAQSAGCVLVQTCLQPKSQSAQALLFENPREVLRPVTHIDLEICLSRIDQCTAKGQFAAGYLSFEAGYALEAKLRPLMTTAAPLAWIGIYDTATELMLPLTETEGETEDNSAEIQFGLSSTAFAEKINQIHQWIREGDVYQINFTDSFRFPMECSPAGLFRRLLVRHPVAHAAFVNTGERQIVSISPELFFERARSRIMVKPMKGTASRGLTTAEDDLIAKQLAASEKNRAENLMIVDLMRNDLGRVARTGSVHVPALFTIERYQSIFQMTSVVEAELKPDIGYADILRAMFPSGSVTGAPKIRAMELIRELEVQPRGVYTGSIGYFASDHANLNVAIRTIEFEGAQAKLGAGSGIVADSIAAEEFEECHAKANFLRTAQKRFSVLESILWQGPEASFRHLAAHLERMRDSAAYFDFPICNKALDQALHDCEQELKRIASGPAKVRLLLDRSGKIKITHAPLSTVRYSRVGLAEERVSSRERFLFHKTTNRALYDQALKNANAEGYDDVLFFNERGELTEGAIHNVFVEIGDELLTPPLASGLLAGIERAHILQTDPCAREQVLHDDDLRNAKQIYLCNSVRGIYPVQLTEQRRTANP